LPSPIEPTNTVSCAPNAISRAFGTDALYMETWKPAGTFRLCGGGAARPVDDAAVKPTMASATAKRCNPGMTAIPLA